MFELEKSILEWKSSFHKSSSVSEEFIEELETHLRESILVLNRKGLNDEESFFVAMKRLGYATALDEEFKKNRPLGVNQDRLIWMLSGYLGITLCGILATTIVSGLSIGMAYVGFGSNVAGVVATLFQLLFWIGVILLAIRESEVTFVFGKYPTMSLTAMFIAMMTLPFVSPIANLAQARVANHTWIAETYIWIGLGHFLVQLLIYAFCFFALYKTRRSKLRIAVSQ